MCNTTRNPFNRAYIKKLPPPEGTFPDESPHILGTPRPYRTLFCCFWDWTYSPARHTPLRHQPHDTRRLDIRPHRHKPSRHKSHRHQPHDTSHLDISPHPKHRHPAILNDAAIVYTTTRLKNRPFMAPAKIEFLKMALPS